VAIPPRPDFHGATDPGRVRKTNEDQFLIAELSRSMLVHQTSLDIRDSTLLAGRRSGYLFLVADGLGGSPAGEEASRLAVDSVIGTVLGTMPWFFRQDDQEEDLEEELKEVLRKCQSSIAADALENPSRDGMATTLTMAYVIWPRLYVVHVGDSRAYLFRGSELTQITEDHTVAEMLPSDEETASPFRMSLWNVLGGKIPEVSPSVYKTHLKERDVLVLATDGLSRQVRNERISAILGASATAAAAVTDLIVAANDAGGRDNVTVAVARFGDRDETAAAPVAAAAREHRPEDPGGGEAFPEAASQGAPGVLELPANDF